MRELKFRAWNVGQKCWVKEFYPLFNGYDEGRSGHWMEGVQGDKDEDLMVSNKEVVICQYTGVKDKNGQEVYEGDILQYGTNVVSVGFNDEIGAFVMKGLETWDCMFPRDEYKPSPFDIIGNIYENRKLLKVK